MTTCPGCGLTKSNGLGTHKQKCIWLIDLETFLQFCEVVERNASECWMWKPRLHKPGKYSYGKFGNDRAHRQAYRVYYRVEPGDLDVCHSCDTPGCINPHHLFLGDASDNIKDAVAKGRHKTPFSDADLRKKFNYRRGDDHYTRLYPEIAAQRVQAMLHARQVTNQKGTTE